jgi:transposase
MKKVPKEVVVQIKHYIRRFYTSREITKLFDVSKSTINNISKKMGTNVRKHKPGRKRSLSKKETKFLMKSFDSGIVQNSNEGVNLVKKNFDKNISGSLVRKVLNEGGFICYKKQKKPLLLEKHVVERLRFCKFHDLWDYFSWKKVIFSDESKFNLEGADGNQRYWMTPSTHQNKQLIIERSKFGGGSVMVWGCVTIFGVGKLIKIDVKMDTV